jgi:hypothetical protein
VCAPVAAYRGRSAASPSAHLPARALSTAIDLIRIAFFGYAIKAGLVFIRVVGDERMTTIKSPEGFASTSCCSALS